METPPSQLRGETREGIVGGAPDRDAADGVDGGDDADDAVGEFRALLGQWSGPLHDMSHLGEHAA